MFPSKSSENGLFCSYRKRLPAVQNQMQANEKFCYLMTQVWLLQMNDVIQSDVAFRSEVH